MFAGSTGLERNTDWELDSWVSSTALLDSYSSVDFGRQVQSASSQFPIICWPPSPRTACRETAFPHECNQQGRCGQHWLFSGDPLSWVRT